MLVIAASLIGGCAPDGPLGTVGAIVTAPVTAPLMFVSARMNDREDHLERARVNDRPLPPIDARSRKHDGTGSRPSTARTARTRTCAMEIGTEWCASDCGNS